MVGLIVLNYNDCDTTKTFINNIKHYKNIDKIIVVDNNSTDSSYENLLTMCSEKIEVLHAEKNNGYASGNNIGAFYAINKYNIDYLIISNPDVYFEESIVDKIIEFKKHNENSAIVTCKMVCTSDIELPSASKLPQFRDCLLENLIILKKFIGNNLQYDKSYLNNPAVKVDVLPGSFFMIDADLFVKVNGFDENTFLYYEENILAFKLKKLGMSNYLLTEESYIHNHSISINKSIQSVKKRLNIAFNSRLYYCSKYLNCSKLQKCILKITYIIGLNNYLIALKITGKKR